MLEKGKIGVHQFTILTILFTVGSAILISPSALAAEARKDAWLAALLGLLAGLALVLLYSRLSARMPGATLTESCRLLLGKWAGGAVALLYAGFFFLLATLVLRNIGDFITTQVLTNTPIQFVHMLFLLVVILGIRNGIETFTRTGEIFLPWVIIFFVFMIVLLPSEIEPRNALPVLGYGLMPLVRASLSLIGTPYLELVVFLAVIPYIHRTRKTGKAFLFGVAFGGLWLVLITLMSILVLGPDLTARHMYPSYSLAKKISVGSFVERVEVIMAGIWFITIYFKLAISFYAAVHTAGELLRLRDVRQLYLPLGMIMVVLAIVVYPNTDYFMRFAMQTWMLVSGTFGLLLPLVLLAAAWLRKPKAPA